MDEQNDRDMADAMQRWAARTDTGEHAAALVNPAAYAEFIALLGPTKAQVWLDEFRQDLRENLIGPPYTTPIRADIHRICGRAGFIGFTALHAACMVALERQGPNPAQHLLQAEAERVCNALDHCP